jgi:hypothetical protein
MENDALILSLSPRNLRRAADLKERIDKLTEELAGILRADSSPSSSPQPGKRKMSAEGRARIAAAARARWARERGGKVSTSSTASESSPKLGTGKRTMSAAARKKIAAAARARWAKVRAAKEGKGT